jgi:hypothetical protein
MTAKRHVLLFCVRQLYIIECTASEGHTHNKYHEDSFISCSVFRLSVREFRILGLVSLRAKTGTEIVSKAC